jgi:chromosome segregation ATPase
MSQSTGRNRRGHRFGWTFAAVLAVGAATFAVSAPGCGSSGGKSESSQKAVNSLTSTRDQIAKAKVEVQQANTALDNLQAGGDVNKSFKAFTKEVADIKAAGDRAKSRAKDLQERQKQYIAQWQKETQDVSSPELRASAEQRRAQVRENFDKIAAAAAGARDAYQPYLKGLQDLQSALAADLTPAGVDAAKPVIQKTKADGDVLIQRIDALVAELDSVGAGMGAAPMKK